MTLDKDTPPFDKDTPPFDKDTPPFDKDTPPFDKDTPPFDMRVLATVRLATARLATVFDNIARFAGAGLLAGVDFLEELILLINDFFWIAMMFSPNLYSVLCFRIPMLLCHTM